MGTFGFPIFALNIVWITWIDARLVPGVSRYPEIPFTNNFQDSFFVDGKLSELGTAYHVKCFKGKHPGTDFSK